MTMYTVSLRQIVAGVIKQTLDVDNIEASSEVNAGQIALGQMGGINWDVVNVQIMGGPESENVKGAKRENWTAELYDAQVERAKLAEGQVTELHREIGRLNKQVGEQIRINEKTAANVRKARKKRRDADERALALGRYTAELKDQISALKDEQERIVEQYEERCAGYAKDRGHLRELEKKHGNLIEKSAALDIENQKLREALRNMEELAVRDEAKAREQTALINAQREALEKAEELQDEIRRVKASDARRTGTIREIAAERDSALAKNRELVKENADAKEHIRKQAQQIDDLVHDRPTERVAGPTRDVDWSEAWAPQLGEDEELTLKTLIGQAIGAASMCWQPIPTGIYWPEKAEWIMGGVINEIEKLVHMENRKPNRTSQPVKPVEALIREQDGDALLWAHAFANQFDLPEDLDGDIIGWFANAMQTAVEEFRNRDHDRKDPAKDFIHPSKIRPFAVKGIPGTNEFKGWGSTPVGQEKALQELKNTFDELWEKIKPGLDVAKQYWPELFINEGLQVSNDGATHAPAEGYPGWSASAFQTKEEWSVTDNLKEKTGKPVGAKAREEVRTVSSTGGEKGMKEERYDLIPVDALAEVARLYGRGAAKYAEHNWRRGYDWSKSYQALQRHATEFWNGQDDDPEMGVSHMASVVFHALALIEFSMKHRNFDDRFKG